MQRDTLQHSTAHYDAFLSYSRQDKAFMQRICQEMQSADLRVWTDETLIPGTDSWKNAIEQAIQSAKHLVVLLSPDAKRSDWIEKEMDYARVCGVPVIPVIIRGDNERDIIPFELVNVQRIDMRADFDRNLSLLISTLKGEHITLPHADKIPVPAPIPARLEGAAAYPPATGSDRDVFNPHNFFDQMQMAWWLLFDPVELHRRGLLRGVPKANKAAAWIGSYMIWLGLLIPAVGYLLGTVQITDATQGNDRLLMIISSVAYLLMWFITGLYGWRGGFRTGFALFVLSGVVTGLTFTINESVSDITFSDTTHLSGVVFTLWTAVTLGYAYGLGAQMANALIGASFGQAAGTLVSFAFLGLPLGSAGGAAITLTAITAALTAAAIAFEMRTARRSWMNYVLLASVGVVIVVMVWVFFLGGWNTLYAINI